MDPHEFPFQTFYTGLDPESQEIAKEAFALLFMAQQVTFSWFLEATSMKAMEARTYLASPKFQKILEQLQESI